MLRLSLASQGALEIPGEGPRVGERQAWAAELPRRPGDAARARDLQLRGLPDVPAAGAGDRATSPPTRCWRCACSTRSPTPPTWAAAAVPGSPYAVALDAVGRRAARRGRSTASSSSRASSPRRARARRGAGPCRAERRLGDAALRPRSRRGFLERLGGAVIALAGARAVVGGGAPRRGRRLHELLRPHLHDRQLPGADRAAADRLRRLPAARLRRRPGRRPRAAGQRARGSRSTRTATSSTDADGVPLAPAPRTQDLRDARARTTRSTSRLDGSWYRCCGGKVRRIRDCCGDTNVRINGDAALVGLLLSGPPRLLRDVLRDLDAVLSGLAVAGGAHGRCSPASPARGRRAASRWSTRSAPRWATPGAA